MKSYFLISCCLILLVIVNVKADETCPLGKNEIFLSLGPNCDRDCGNLNKPCAKKGEPHRTGCFCRSGFARDSERVCVPIATC